MSALSDQQLVLLADAVHPLHEDAVCGHLLAPHDCFGVPARVHAAVLQSWGGGPRCACCGRHSSNAGVQRGLHRGTFLWHLCCFQALSVAPFLGAVAGMLLVTAVFQYCSKTTCYCRQLNVLLPAGIAWPVLVCIDVSFEFLCL